MDSTLEAVIRSWPFEPWVLITLMVTPVLYLRGWLVLHGRDPERWSAGKLGAFALGLGALFLAIGGSIGEEIVSSSDQLCAAEAKTSFAADVMPIFVGRCFGCHQPGGQGNEKSGLDLSSYEGVMKGTRSGKMVIPGDPDRKRFRVPNR